MSQRVTAEVTGRRKLAQDIGLEYVRKMKSFRKLANWSSPCRVIKDEDRAPRL
jgi:hypothetical protein